ncbi:Right handed beta helix region [Nannocystis exedens]|uniref:Right handed beta helix region n=1 Tax=Nannocystis exedens TaxID=54 RepID=A0A1I2CY52_9BACT|nr:right-handed parallel beta-helix repeat-containing protein [Nannocystis exedens]PCC68629.1 hypothetical protein NAEX_01645 [Nannocystis exedens]SFE72670.1 Right handed beta helix region [Nannocystis exedens]
MMRLLPATLLACAGCAQLEDAPGAASGTESSSSEPTDDPGGCVPGETTGCPTDHDGPLGLEAPQRATHGPTYTLTPLSGDGACTSIFTFNGTPLKGTPSADWCQIQQAVNAVRAGGVGGTIELVSTGQAFRLTGPIMLNADDLTVIGLPDAQGHKPEIDFDPPPCTYTTTTISVDNTDVVVGHCAEGSEINYSAFTVNDQTPGCAHPIIDGTYCPRERVSLQNLKINVRRGLAGPPTTQNQATQPTIASQSVIMLMNCGDCEVLDTDLAPAYVAGGRGVSQDGITFGPGSTGRLGGTGTTPVSVVDMAKAGLYLTPLSGIHVDAGGATDDSGVAIDNVSVSDCGGSAGWGSGISISGHGGAVNDCTIADNHANGILVAPQPLGPPAVASSWIAVQSTQITDCDVHHNAGPGVVIGSAASAYGVDFVPEDAVLTRVSAHDNSPYDGVRIEGARHVSIDGGTFYGNNAGITLANQTAIVGMTSDIAISGVTAYGNNYYGLFFIGVHDVSVDDSLLYNPQTSSSPAVGNGVGLWGSYFDNSEIALHDLNIGENGITIVDGGEAVSGLYSLIGKAGPSNPSGSPNSYAGGVGLHAPQGSTYVDATHGVTYSKSTGAADPKGWVVTP